MCTLLTNKRYELLYNCGIQLLHIGRPLAAFECLIEAVQVYHSNPRLWLRIAECCIAANKGVSGFANSLCLVAVMKYVLSLWTEELNFKTPSNLSHSVILSETLKSYSQQFCRFTCAPVSQMRHRSSESVGSKMPLVKKKKKARNLFTRTVFSSLEQGKKLMGHLFTYCRPTKALDHVGHLELNVLPPTAVTLYGVSGSVNLGNKSSLMFPKFVILWGRS